MFGYAKKIVNKEFEQNEEYYQKYTDYYSSNLNMYQRGYDIFLMSLLILGLFLQLFLFGWAIEFVALIGFILLEMIILFLKYQRNSYYYALILFNYYFIQFLVLFNVIVAVKIFLNLEGIRLLLVMALIFVCGSALLSLVNPVKIESYPIDLFAIKDVHVENNKVEYRYLTVGSTELERKIRKSRRIINGSCIIFYTILAVLFMAELCLLFIVIDFLFVKVCVCAYLYFFMWICFTSGYMQGHTIEYLYHKYKKVKNSQPLTFLNN